MLWSRWDIIKSSDVPVGTDSKIAIELCTCNGYV